MSEETKPDNETKALARRDAIAVGDRGLALRTFDDLQRFCQAAIHSGYFKGMEEVAQAVVKVQYGMELGIPPVSAMQGVYIVEGKPSLSAGLIAARIKSSGIYSYRITEMSDERCRLEFFEHGQPVGPSEFAIEDARKAGVAGKSVWKNYPRNMLFARAVSNGARWYCADIFMGSVYTPEELGGSETIEVPRQPAPQPPAPKAPTPVSPPAASAPSVAVDDEPPPPDDADGPPEDAETPREHARQAAAVKAAETELGAQVEGVRPPPPKKPTNIYDHAKTHGFRDPALVDKLIAAQFGERKFRDLSLDEKKQAADLIAAEGVRRKKEGAAIVRGAKGAA